VNFFTRRYTKAVGQPHVLPFLPGTYEPPAQTVLEAGWNREQVLKLWRSLNYLPRLESKPSSSVISM